MKVLRLTSIITVLGTVLTNRLAAQNFTTLHSFSATTGPGAGLQASGDTLFGAASAGTFGSGTIYKLNKDGAGFAILHNFARGAVVGSGYWTNSDGVGPGSLTISSNIIYGSCGMGGAPGCGTLFKLNADGTGFTLLHTFSALENATDGVHGTHTGGTNTDGSSPAGRKILSGNRLFGTTEFGGSGQSGTIFAINTDGTGFTNLYSFSAADPANNANPDGAVPSDLVLLSNTLYGTTIYGGSSGVGTVFAINTDGSGFTNLHSFASLDGAGPLNLIASGNTLYGTTYEGGSSWPGGSGTIFSLNTDGSGFNSLYDFTDIAAAGGTNTDGTSPQCELLPSNNLLYGSASYGGAFANGTVFAVNTDGTGFTNLYTFSAAPAPYWTNTDGGTPAGTLVLINNSLYGTTTEFGPELMGTVFNLSLGTATLPQLQIAQVSSSILLAWPGDATGYILQSAHVLVNGGDWQDSALIPNQTNGQNVVSLSTSSAASFFRLRRQ